MASKLMLKFLLWLTESQIPLLIDVDYMERWFIIRRNKISNLYFHKFFGSDAPTPHDHPWWSVSWILKGTYLEHTPKGTFRRKAGDITFRRATDLHWIEIEEPVYTLFFTGPRRRRWGFQCPKGWVDFKEYIDRRGDSRLASGCGED